MRKNYVLDTNVLLADADSIYKFEENNVYIPMVVIDELDGLKESKDSETAYNARRANRALQMIQKEMATDGHTALDNGGMLVFYPAYDSYKYMKEYGLSDKNDHKIISVVLEIRDRNLSEETILVTNDIAMQIKSVLYGINVQDYKNQQLEYSYTGRKTIADMPAAEIDCLYSDKQIPCHHDDCEENQFILLKSSEDIQKQALAICKEHSFHLIKNDMDGICSLPNIQPKNLGQKYALYALNHDFPLTILSGPAGTGKTYLSLAVGLKMVMEGKVRQVLLLRPQAFFDSEIGFLPGDEQSKIDPLMRPFYDNLESILELNGYDSDKIQEKITKLFATGKLRAESFAYIRGRNITNSFIILDEAQNATRSQIQGAVTRAGSKSRIVLCGDPEQVDNPQLDSHNNGLVFAMNKMKGSRLCCQMSFEKNECCRSPLAEEATKRMF